MSQKTAFAVRCSLAVLLSLKDHRGETEFNIQKTPTLPLSGSLYLWTFTFPDVTTLEQASRRWTAFNQRMRKAKISVQWMRFFEPHASHGWHVHCAAAKHIDVTMIRTLATRFGFGRMHVKRIPSQAAGYLLKYVTKYKRHSSDGRYRLWACCGFKGVTVAQVRVEDTWATYCYSQVGFAQVGKFSLPFIYRNGLEAWAKQTRIGDAKTKKHMNPAQSKVANDLLNVGAKIAFCEYRSSKLREAKKYIDGRASLSEKSYYHAHLLESGATPLLVEEPLPDSFRPDDKLVPPMKKGQTCIVEFVKVSVFNGKETYAAKFHAIA